VSADDIYLKTGTVLRNVQWIGFKERFSQQHAFFLYNGKEESVNTDVFLRVDVIPFDSTVSSSREIISDSTRLTIAGLHDKPKTGNDSLKQLYEKISGEHIAPRKTYPNSSWYYVAILSAGLSWDFFSRVGDVQVTIDAFEKYNKATSNNFYDTSELRTSKTRYLILGGLCGAGAIYSFGYAITGVEIKTDGKSLSLAYNF